jgi:tetratricopeptide (TPR) repeat protein
MDSYMRPPLIWTWFVIAAISCLHCSVAAAGENSSDDDAQVRRRAAELFDAGRFTEALPVYEQLVKDHPEDAVFHEHYGFLLAATFAEGISDEQRRTQRLKARSELLRAKQLGDNSSLVQIFLGEIPMDGASTPFSGDQSVERLMRSAEGAFQRGDYEVARTGYLLALQSDPTLYEAALFMGDVLYKQQKLSEAGTWFQRAIEINPNRETAYRYWGDALMVAGDMAGAREKFINAIVAEPYVRLSRVGLSQWVDRNQLRFNVPQLESPITPVSDGGKKTGLSVNANSPQFDDQAAMGMWLIYATVRAAWMDGKFVENFPDEKKYRHSLAEEVAAYKTAAAFAQSKEDKSSDKQKASQLDVLAELISEDLLESYILLFQPDEGVAQDYPAYRDAHRESLRRMLYRVTPQLERAK